VQVRTGYAPGAAYQADLLADLHLVADFNVDARLMQ
jgi:hypothetical protein